MVQSMKIYIGHSSSINYKEELYRPLKESELASDHDLVFPHDDSEEQFDSKNFLRDEADLMIAEVSKSSTGLGIELGWANIYEVPVLLICSKDSEVSRSLEVISDDLLRHKGRIEMVEILEEEVQQL